MPVWILVADRARARILTPDRNSSELLEVEDLVHPESHLREGEVITDRPGRFQKSASKFLKTSGSRHSGESETDFKHETAEKFALEIVRCLEKGLQKKQYDKLAVVAPPLFLGVLRKKLPAAVSQAVEVELDKDFSLFTAEQIRDRLPKSLWD